MTIAIDEATQVITIDQADLTFVSGALYEMDTNAYRLAVGALLDDERYIWMDSAFNHNGEVTVAGVTLARVIEQTNGYSLTFENITYSVRLAGSNNNFFDVENGILNPGGNVTVIGNNSAGLITGAGSGAFDSVDRAKLDDTYDQARIAAGNTQP
jgi:hypothetical protein